jgi:hypothetical protein
MSGGAQYELSGTLHVPLPPDEAFRLFTPRGEEDWVPGWKPEFPVPAVDDSAPGTVFETDAHGTRTTWLVVDRDRPRRVAYARITPGVRAALVTVELAADGIGSAVTVTYALTALSDAARPGLDEFAAGYDAYLASWREWIEAWLTAR